MQSRVPRLANFENLGIPDKATSQIPRELYEEIKTHIFPLLAAYIQLAALSKEDKITFTAQFFNVFRLGPFGLTFFLDYMARLSTALYDSYIYSPNFDGPSYLPMLKKLDEYADAFQILVTAFRGRTPRAQFDPIGFRDLTSQLEKDDLEHFIVSSPDRSLDFAYHSPHLPSPLKEHRSSPICLPCR